MLEAEGPKFPSIVFERAEDTGILVEAGDGGAAVRPLEHTFDHGSIRSWGRGAGVTTEAQKEGCSNQGRRLRYRAFCK